MAAVFPFPSVRFVAWSAFVSGSLRSVLLRSSSRSRSGAVLVASFACPRRAGRFARRWAVRLGLPVAVRRAPAVFGAPGPRWAVSVPVAVASSRSPRGAGRVLPVAGGVWGFAALLRRSGLAVWGVPRGCPVPRSAQAGSREAAPRRWPAPGVPRG